MEAVKVPVTAEQPRETSHRPNRGPSEVERRNQRTAELLERGEIDLAVKINLPIADSLARRYRSRGEDLDDLVQVARLGLIQAASRFNPDNGEFLSFAVPTITGEIKRHFRDHCWTVRPPRRIQELHSEVTAAWSELAQEQARTPTPGEVADWLGMDRAEVLEAMTNSTFNSASLDATDGTPTSAKDRLGTPDPGFDDVEESMEREQLMGEVRRACRKLTAEDRKILQMRFGEGCTQSVIAEELGISQMSVSRRLAKITRTLRQELRAQRNASPTQRTMKVRQVMSRPQQPTR